MTAGEAITALQVSRDVEVVFYLYVIDVRRHLVGVVSLRRLLLVSPETPLKRIMTTDIISVRVDMDQEEVARQVASYNLLAIPVVDEENKLVGVITVDDVIDVIKDEATEDIYRLAGVTGDERVFTPAPESLRKRLPWLGVNLATAFLAASVVGLFTATLDALPVLAVFMPIVAGMGGNAATQTLTVIVRGIALGELTWANSRKALFKEAAVGLGNGFACGMVGALIVWVWKGDLVLGLILCAAMVINMFVAATAGTVIPLALRAMKVDPALASSVFITTLTDVFGFASWRGLAKGARRAKSRFAGALESLTRAGVAYYERELRDLVRINYIEPQRSPLAIVARNSDDAAALGHAEYFAELIDEWAPEGHADERLYRLGSSVIDAFAD